MSSEMIITAAIAGLCVSIIKAIFIEGEQDIIQKL